MRKKNIVMLYRKRKPNEAHFFDRLGKKSEVYKYYFRHGTKKGFNMYFVSGIERYLGNMRFKNPLFFDGKDFTHKKEIITADAVFDRSGGVKFPTNEISHKTLNCIEFKKICWNKLKTYALLGRFMPRSYAVRSQEDLLKNLEQFPRNFPVVLKPARGLGGKGIVIGKRGEIKKRKVNKNLYILQEFVDTSGGIIGVVSGRHDLRVAIVEGKVILAHVRTPRPGRFLANVAQGGSIREIPLSKIPKSVLKIVHEAQKKIDENFDYPLYSIDFGLKGNKPFIFEINDQIGFPTTDMKNYKIFVKRILKSMERLSEVSYLSYN
jgi:glutathione synthase/RimK-type ligase-like ATP-grasp enzyme